MAAHVGRSAAAECCFHLSTHDRVQALGVSEMSVTAQQLDAGMMGAQLAPNWSTPVS